MTAVLVAGALAAAFAPHVIDLDRTPSAHAVAIWVSALALRALAAVSLAALVVLYLPGTGFFSLVTHWCWHSVVPFVAAHLPVDGHMVGDAALIAPAGIIVVSVGCVLVGGWRGARAVRRFVGRQAIGAGPGGSVIIREAAVLLAAAGFLRPRIVVSAGALVALDDEELAAGLAHERGHIARAHRFVLLAGQVLAALGCLIPGTRRALAELELHLERDADAFAARTHERLALASAICKSALSCGPAPAMALDGSKISRRLASLLDDVPPGRAARLPRALAFALVTLTLGSAAAMPVSAASAFDGVPSGPSLEHCKYAQTRPGPGANASDSS